MSDQNKREIKPKKLNVSTEVIPQMDHKYRAQLAMQTAVSNEQYLAGRILGVIAVLFAFVAALGSVGLMIVMVTAVGSAKGAIFLSIAIAALFLITLTANALFAISVLICDRQTLAMKGMSMQHYLKEWMLKNLRFFSVVIFIIVMLLELLHLMKNNRNVSLKNEADEKMFLLFCVLLFLGIGLQVVIKIIGNTKDETRGLTNQVGE